MRRYKNEKGNKKFWLRDLLSRVCMSAKHAVMKGNLLIVPEPGFRQKNRLYKFVVYNNWTTLMIENPVVNRRASHTVSLG